jgi:hypothetical protein
MESCVSMMPPTARDTERVLAMMELPDECRNLPQVAAVIGWVTRLLWKQQQFLAPRGPDKRFRLVDRLRPMMTGDHAIHRVVVMERARLAGKREQRIIRASPEISTVASQISSIMSLPWNKGVRGRPVWI